MPNGGHESVSAKEVERLRISVADLTARLAELMKNMERAEIAIRLLLGALRKIRGLVDAAPD